MSERRRTAVRESAIQVLVPLATLLLSARMGYGDMVALAKAAFVRAALKNAGSAGHASPSVSRIAVETGLTRGEVGKILGQRGGKVPRPVMGRARAERVLSGWLNDPEFEDKEGKPAALRMRGPLPSLVTLVQRYSGTARAQPIVEELLRSGAVKRLRDGRFRVIRTTCTNIAWSEDNIAGLGRELRLHFEALLHNLRMPDLEPEFAGFIESGLIDPLQARVLLRDLKVDGQLLLDNALDRLNQEQRRAKEGLDENAARRFFVGLQILERPARTAAVSPRKHRRTGASVGKTL